MPCFENRIIFPKNQKNSNTHCGKELLLLCQFSNFLKFFNPFFFRRGKKRVTLVILILNENTQNPFLVQTVINCEKEDQKW